MKRLRMYISGDTLIHERLREIPRRFPDIDLALLHQHAEQKLNKFMQEARGGIVQ